MRKPIQSAAEAARLVALRAYDILDTAAEPEFDAAVRIAASICATPVALMSLLDEDRQWFKARIGLAASELPRALSFCTHALAAPDRPFVVPDARLDERFAANPLVAEPGGIRFYAGIALRTPAGPLGTLCVLDTVPRTLQIEQITALEELASQIVYLLEQRRTIASLTLRAAACSGIEGEAALLTAAVAGAHDAIVIFKRAAGDADAQIEYVNPAFTELTGFPAADVIGTTAGTIQGYVRTAGGDFNRVRASMLAGRSASLEIELPGKDGRQTAIEVSAAPVPAIDTATTYYVTVLRDITDRRRAERAQAEATRLATENVALARSEARLRTIFARTPALMWTLDRTLTCDSAFGGGLAATGVAPDESVGMSLEHMFERLDDPQAARAAHERALLGESASFDRNFGTRTFQFYIEPLRDADGTITGVAGVAFDVTEYRRSAQQLARSEAHIARTERTARVGSWEHEIASDRYTLSAEFLRLFELDPDDERDAGAAYRRRIFEADQARFFNATDEAYRAGEDQTNDFRIRRSDGQTTHLREAIELVRDGEGCVVGARGLVLDITERKEAEEALVRLAQTDDLTGLPNRALLFARLAPAQGGLPQAPPTLLLVDLDRFTTVNDAYGHRTGDLLLCAAADRIAAAVAPAFVARAGTDEFAVVVAAAEDAGELARSISLNFERPFTIGDREIFCTATVGIAPGEANVESPEDLLRRAHGAMSSAKALGGGGIGTYDATMLAGATQRVGLDYDLRQAVERDEFVLHYQPILREGRVTTIEALLRWQHPTRGLVMPDLFIPLAEQTGAIVPIGRWVVRCACFALAGFRRNGAEGLRVAVNLSPKQFGDPLLLRTIREALRDFGLEAAALDLEITESAYASDPAAAGTLLAELRALGVTISIDDFGTGYSSFAALQRMPIDTLKIDRSFARDLPGDHDACAIVEAIVALGKALQLDLIAEGVETQEQADYLQAHGATMLQGWLFSRAVPAGALLATIDRLHAQYGWVSLR